MLKKTIIIAIAVLSLAFVGTAFAGGMGPANMDAGRRAYGQGGISPTISIR